MRQVARKGLITVAAAGGVLAVTGGYAHADSGAEGDAADSPGALAGNTVQVPVDVSVNACGNTVNVGGLLNPATGNRCRGDVSVGGGQGQGHGQGQSHGQGQGRGQGQSDGQGSAQGSGEARRSPGGGSGNTVQVPVDVPVNACGNSVTVVGGGNAAHGNGCADEETTLPPSSPSYPDEPRGSSGDPREAGDEPSSSQNPHEPHGLQGPHESDGSQDARGSDGPGGAQGQDGRGDGKGGRQSTGAPGSPSSPGSPGPLASPGPSASPDAPDAPGGQGGGGTSGSVGEGVPGSGPVSPSVGPEPHTQIVTPPKGGEQLARTGAGALGTAIPVSAGMLVAGAVLYRRSRSAPGGRA